MSVDLPTWIEFDPETPATLPALPSTAGRIVALVASSGATSAGWGPAVAVELARGWSRQGSRVVLADLGLTRPTVHRALGEPEGEGVTDVVAFGASPTRVARPIEGETFFMVPAGTVVADVAAALALPRWRALCEGFRDAGVLLALYVPADEPGLPTTLAVATDAVILADEHEDAGGLVDGHTGLPVRGILGPPATPPTDGAERITAPVEETGPDLGSEPFAAPVDMAAEAAFDPPQAEGFGEVVQASSEGVAPSTSPVDLPPVVEPSGQPERAEAVEPVASAEPVQAVVPVVPEEGAWEPDRGVIHRHAVGSERRSSRTVFLLVVLVLVIVGVLVAAWLGYVTIPGITPAGGRVGDGGASVYAETVVHEAASTHAIARADAASVGPAQRASRLPG